MSGLPYERARTYTPAYVNEANAVIHSDDLNKMQDLLVLLRGAKLVMSTKGFEFTGKKLEIVSGIDAFCTAGNGQYLFITSGTDLFRYTLSVPGDIRTASIDTGIQADLSVLIPGASVYGLQVSQDGLNLMLMYNFIGIYQFKMSTPFDLTTASLNSSLVLADSHNSVLGFSFSLDGNILIYSSKASGDFHKYTMTSGWNLFTASYVIGGGPWTSSETLGAIKVSPDGERIMFTDDMDSELRQIFCYDGFDIIQSELDDYKVSTGGFDWVTWSDYGDQIYAMEDGSDVIRQYNCGMVIAQ